MKTQVGLPPVLRRCCVGVFALMLGACNAPLDSALEGGASYRDASVPIGVTSRFEGAKFEGRWRVRAFLPADEAIDGIALNDGANGLQMQVVAFVCDGAGICGTFGEDLSVKREGEGRYLVRLPDGTQRRLWVLWVDEGFRTAVIGNPEGTFAWILDRSATGGADRINAAREILDFNGYDVSQLKVNK